MKRIAVVGVPAFIAGAVLFAGCGIFNPQGPSGVPTPGGGDTDVRAAVERWASAVMAGDTQSLTTSYDSTYCYDGREGAPVLDGGMFAQPTLQTNVQIISIEENNGRAIARVQVHVWGTAPWYMAVPGISAGVDDGVDWAGTTPPPEEPIPSAPDLFVDPGTRTGANQPSTGGNGFASLPSDDPSADRQDRLVPFSLSVIYVLELVERDGGWLIVAQREEALTSLVGENARAPVFGDVRVNGGSDEPIEAGAQIAVEGQVSDVSDSQVLVNVGTQYATLPVSAEAFSGNVRAPGSSGRYALRISAGNVDQATGSAGFSRVSFEVQVTGGIEPGRVDFEVADGVSVDSSLAQAVEQWVRSRAEPDTLVEFYVPDYSYNQNDRYIASWQFATGPTSETHAVLTGVTAVGEAQRVALRLVEQFGEGDWYWAIEPQPVPEYGGGRVDSGTTGELIATRSFVEGEWTRRLELVMDFVRQSDAWLIQAQRAAHEAGYQLGEVVPMIEGLAGNGSSAPTVAGRATVHVVGHVSPAASSVVVSLGARSEWAEVSSGDFAVDIQAPYRGGRYVLRADTASDVWNGEVAPGTASASIEVVVDAPLDAPPVAVSVAPGVAVTDAEKALVERWLAAAVNPYESRIRPEVYHPDYSLDGLTHDEIVDYPTLTIYQEAEGLAEIRGAEDTENGRAVELHLELNGDVWVNFPYWYDDELPPGPEPMPVDNTVTPEPGTRPLQDDGQVIGIAPAPDGGMPRPAGQGVVGEVSLEINPAGDRLAVTAEYFPSIATVFGGEQPPAAQLTVAPLAPATGAAVAVSGQVNPVGSLYAVLRLAGSTQQVSAESGAFRASLTAPETAGRYLVHVQLSPLEWYGWTLMMQRVVNVGG